MRPLTNRAATDHPTKRWQHPGMGLILGLVCFLLTVALQPDSVISALGYILLLFYSSIGPFALLSAGYGWVILPSFFIVCYFIVTRTHSLLRFVLLACCSYAWLCAGSKIMFTP